MKPLYLYYFWCNAYEPVLVKWFAMRYASHRCNESVWMVPGTVDPRNN